MSGANIDLRPEIVLIAHDMRSCHNVGSLLRTADALGVAKVFLTGYTPYPLAPNDPRMPHIAAKIAKQIHKTALGAEESVDWEQRDDILPLLATLQAKGFTVVALEQAENSVALHAFTAPAKVALLLGREVEGIDPILLKKCDVTLEIPMLGQKESLNVVQAAAMALFQFRFASS